MVIEVSAMLVATTTLTTPGGGVPKTFICSSEESDECSGRIHARCAGTRSISGASCSRLTAVSISFRPGRKHSTAPPSLLPPPLCLPLLLLLGTGARFANPHWVSPP